MLIYPVLRVFGSPMDEFTRLGIHRGISHSILFLPLLAIPLAALWYKLRRWPRRQKRSDDSALSPVLYVRGSGAGDAPAIGPVHRLRHAVVRAADQRALCARRRADNRLHLHADSARHAFGVLVFAAGAARRPARHAHHRLGGILLSTGYLFAGLWLHDRAIECARERFGDNGTAVSAQYEAYPQFGSIFEWRVVRHVPGKWTAVRVMPLADPEIENLALSSAPDVDNEWSSARASWRR